jgi:hypothetical protein
MDNVSHAHMHDKDTEQGTRLPGWGGPNGPMLPKGACRCKGGGGCDTCYWLLAAAGWILRVMVASSDAAVVPSAADAAPGTIAFSLLVGARRLCLLPWSMLNSSTLPREDRNPNDTNILMLNGLPRAWMLASVRKNFQSHIYPLDVTFAVKDNDCTLCDFCVECQSNFGGVAMQCKPQ